ncbi:MAG TPA: polysaccharide deacetylase family protein [Pseudogracilibacillus sp.]|nr:polysaccharide deacetylase family protein [Pseudogracilibacillus sp.]
MTNTHTSKHLHNNGYFIISLDFELYWGVHDVFRKESYADVLYNTRKIIPSLLQIFTEYQIHATWAIVGMLNVKNKNELYKRMPTKLPAYRNQKLSSYNHITQVDTLLQEDLYFAPELVRAIQQTGGQEIGSHTFSHYYCLEDGQTEEDFLTDALLFNQVMEPVTTDIHSIVFPRNQVSLPYLSICSQVGMKAYRGNEPGWIYQMKGNDRKHIIKRGLRLLDMYVNLFGHQSYQITDGKGLLNIRGSRQLKPAAKRLRSLEKRRLNRILSSMTYAAKNKRIYHLWWHPHNFGDNPERNFDFLRKILIHYKYLNKYYGFESNSMGEIAKKILSQTDSLNDIRDVSRKNVSLQGE